MRFAVAAAVLLAACGGSNDTAPRTKNAVARGKGKQTTVPVATPAQQTTTTLPATTTTGVAPTTPTTATPAPIGPPKDVTLTSPVEPDYSYKCDVRIDRYGLLFCKRVVSLDVEWLRDIRTRATSFTAANKVFEAPSAAIDIDEIGQPPAPYTSEVVAILVRATFIDGSSALVGGTGPDAIRWPIRINEWRTVNRFGSRTRPADCEVRLVGGTINVCEGRGVVQYTWQYWTASEPIGTQVTVKNYGDSFTLPVAPPGTKKVVLTMQFVDGTWIDRLSIPYER